MLRKVVLFSCGGLLLYNGANFAHHPMQQMAGHGILHEEYDLKHKERAVEAHQQAPDQPSAAAQSASDTGAVHPLHISAKMIDLLWRTDRYNCLSLDELYADASFACDQSQDARSADTCKADLKRKIARIRDRDCTYQS